jgi:hypothetical protein
VQGGGGCQGKLVWVGVQANDLSTTHLRGSTTNPTPGLGRCYDLVGDVARDSWSWRGGLRALRRLACGGR